MARLRFGAWLASQLARRDWSQADFARRIGKSSGAVNMWINGNRIPDPASCDLIADALGRGVSLDDVLIAAGHKDAPDSRRLNADQERIIERIRRLPWDDGWTKWFDGMLDVAESVRKSDAPAPSREPR